MDRERVIVYIDENTDDGMMWEELNQKGKMQVSVFDEEYESWSEYHHSIVVKSLQEYLTDYTKQVRKEVCEEIKKFATNNREGVFTNEFVNYYDLLDFLNDIQGENNET